MDKSTDYKYYSFDAENSILYHEVRDENFGNKESFVLSLSYFSTLIEKFRPKNIIINVYKKPGFFELDLKGFMDRVLYNTIIKVGTKKIAFNVPDKSYYSELKKHESNDPIQARFFFDIESAKKWILS